MLLAAMLFPTVAAWLYFVVFADRGSLLPIYTASKLVQFTFPVVWVLAVRRDRLPRLSLAAPATWDGLGSGLLIVSLLALAYAGLSGSSLVEVAGPRILARVEAIGAATPVRFLGMALFLSLIHSFLEEYYWRWFVFDGLSTRYGFRAALVWSSLAFASHHVIVVNAFLGLERWPITAAFALLVAGAGGLWAWLYRRGGSLTGPWLSHALADLGILSIGYHLVSDLL